MHEVSVDNCRHVPMYVKSLCKLRSSFNCGVHDLQTGVSSYWSYGGSRHVQVRQGYQLHDAAAHTREGSV